MRISRREFLKYCTIAAGALGLTTSDLLKIEETFAKVGDGGPHVVWIAGQACTGCTMSLTNSIYYTDVGSLLLNDIDLDYNEQLCAASGDRVVEKAISAIGKTMVLAIEGAIPHGDDANGNDQAEFCTIWTRTGGVIAANSKLGATTFAGGTLVGAGSATFTIATGNVLKAGSELVAGTIIPDGAEVTSAADRAAMAAMTPAATFRTSGTGGGGSNVLNTKVKLTSDRTTAGQIKIAGGTENGRAGSTLAATSQIRTGSTVTNSFDRADIEAWAATVATLPTHKVSWTDDGDGNPYILNTSALPAPYTNAYAMFTGSREVSGPLYLATSSIIRNGSILMPGTVVISGPFTTAGTDQNFIDPSGAKFGYMVSGSAVYLNGPWSVPSTKEIFLNGDINLDPLNGTGTITIGGTAKTDKTMLHECQLFGTSAAAVLCVGTCSSFGGIPAATGNLTGAAGALYKGYVKAGRFNGALNDFAAKTINIPGCPPHSDWIVGTIAYLLARNLQAFPPLEAYSRPLDYYGMYQCNAGPCEWRYNQGYVAIDETIYANPKPAIAYTGPGGGTIPIANVNCTKNSSKLYKYKWANTSYGKRAVGCLGAIGCKGRKTKADCSLRRWNADENLKYGTGWCVASGAGCHGCTEPTFPDKVGKFFNFA